ncbi:HD-GYP domain-containing protein [Aquibacillus sediminis]|uniref:HD-GYP domain-containing protein n=1 Tax=Aquibacillus sediminis TaxID=2574734 RepID=UPI0011099A2A|nr:HD-GYP domain-containing protein [Aquibacillus sediminis]
MWVHPKQLKPGCVIEKDVLGKTNRPIVPQDTVLKDIEITVLENFLVEKVKVAPKLADGTPFEPKDLEAEEDHSDSLIYNQDSSFEVLYQQAVKEYKKLFIRLQSGNAIDINYVRKFMMPLLLQTERVGIDIYLLYNYSTKEDYVYHHSVSMAILSAFMAKKIGYTKEWLQVGLAGLLADSGMAKMSRQLYLKKGELTLPEYQEIKKHPALSYRLVEHIPSLSTGAKLAILQHHERVDGNGYPLGVTQDKIHPYARILAISDTYHAMTSERMYKAKLSPFKVIDVMLKDNFIKYDHQLLQQFITSLTNLVNGLNVRLSNNQFGEIVYIDAKSPTRPMVRVENTSEIITLKTRPDLHIEEIIK